MKNLKPSEFPKDTIIGTMSWGLYQDLYIKREGNWWEDLFSGCGCCTDHEHISDAGCSEDEKYYTSEKLTTTKTSDEYFEDYKVVALPPGYSIGEDQLHGAWSREKQVYSDGTGIHQCYGVNCEAEVVW